MELPDSIKFIVVVCVLLGVVGTLIFSRLRPLAIFSASALVLYVTDILSIHAFAANYVNPSLLTLAVLLLLSVVLEKTSLLSWLAKNVVRGGPKTVQFRLALLSGLTSAFLNNTAVVAALMGPLRKQSTMLASKLLLPLSYASILGGMLTLIGTSTNLIVNGFVEQSGIEPFSFFDFSLIGLPVFVVCLMVMVFISSRFLPSYSLKDQKKEASEYFLERCVAKDSPLVNRSVAENGLRNLEKLFLVDVIRENRVVSPVAPSEILQAGDILVFSGDPAAIELLDAFEGLESQEDHKEQLRDNLVEVVVSPSSVLLGRSIKEADFRARFDAAVVAVRRGEQRITGGVGNFKLRAGDGLVLAVGSDFKRRRNLGRNFITVGGVETGSVLSHKASIGVIAGFIGAVALSAFGVVPFFKSLLVLLTIFILLRVIRIDELRRRFPFELILVIGGALGLAEAMVSTGVADVMAQGVNGVFGSLGVYGAYVGIFLVTWLLTELVTNNAAAALVFPIAYATAQQWGVSPYPFFMAVAFGASASFLSPYGYQTNLMVFSAGRYNIRDYFKVGTPVLLAYSVTALVMIPVVFPF